MPRVSRSLLLVPLAGALLATAAHADVVAGWTIEAPVPSGTSGPEYSYGAAEQGANIAGSDLNGVHANPETFWISPPGNGSQYSFGNNRWTIGDYFQVEASTLGYQDISISFDQCRNSNGAVFFDLLMSVDEGASWTTLLSSYEVLQSGGGGSPGTWSASADRNPIYLVEADAGAMAADRESVWFRMQAVSEPGSAVSSISRLDNVFIEGNVVPAPGAMALLGLAGLASRRRRR